MNSNRFAEFDVLKGIGIILVLFGHTAIPMEAKNVIYMFHMPLFFLCSGLFYKSKSIPQQIANDAKRLLIPWLTFFVIYQLAYFAILQVPTPNISRYIDYVAENYSLLNEHSIWYFTIWFLPCLFLIRTLYNIIYRLCKGNNVAVAAITGVVFDW
ncbi:MAG: acyltransferase family protein [Muribaculaceae bacterium]